MILTIKKDNKFITEGFIRFLVRLLRREVLSMLDKRGFEKTDNFLRSLGLNISSEETVLLGVRNLTYTETEKDYSIHIDHNEKVAGTNYKVETLCKIIEYGNTVCKPQRIFTESIKHIEDNISKYYDFYCFMPI